jgi:hypothetical protein
MFFSYGSLSMLSLSLLFFRLLLPLNLFFSLSSSLVSPKRFAKVPYILLMAYCFYLSPFSFYNFLLSSLSFLFSSLCFCMSLNLPFLIKSCSRPLNMNGYSYFYCGLLRF